MNISLILEQYAILFEKVLTPDQILEYDAGYLADMLLSLLPVHVGLSTDNYSDVDGLLSLYPYLYQKIVVLHSHMVHKVRVYSTKNTSSNLGKARDLRDTLEQILRTIKLQYDSISRRITLRVENR